MGEKGRFFRRGEDVSLLTAIRAKITDRMDDSFPNALAVYPQSDGSSIVVHFRTFENMIAEKTPFQTPTTQKRVFFHNAEEKHINIGQCDVIQSRSATGAVLFRKRGRELPLAEPSSTQESGF